MALDVVFVPPGCRPDPREAPAATLGAGTYWFLLPLWEPLRARTTQRLDLYGDATFRGDQLAGLAETLAEAAARTREQSSSWELNGSSRI